MDRCKEIERGLITAHRKGIWSRFVKAVKEYQLVEEGDRIAVCISGGKDSMLLAKCMQELARHGEKKFGLEFIVMDPGYAPENRALIESNAQLLQIPVHIFETQIFDAVTQVEKILAISARACGGGICTKRLPASAATRSRSDITSTM